MSVLESYKRIQEGATEVDMLNDAKNKMTASHVATLLDSGQPEQAQSLFEIQMHANKTIANFKKANPKE